MSITSTESPIIAKTRELCAEIAGDATFLRLQSNVERFLSDDSSRLQYQSIHERGEELHQKQHAGIELGAAEIRDFETAREALFQNEVAMGFLDAQKQLEGLQKEISKYVGMTMELGRVPTEEEIEEAQGGGGGCCGGEGGGGGCGCSH